MKTLNKMKYSRAKNTLLALVIALPLTTALSGCVIAVGGDKGDYDYAYDFEDKEQENRHKLTQLQPNMSFVEVKTIMGIPDFNEVYEKNGETIQVLFYRTHRTKKDGLTTKDECTPLIFKENKLVSWGEAAYSQI